MKLSTLGSCSPPSQWPLTFRRVWRFWPRAWYSDEIEAMAERWSVRVCRKRTRERKARMSDRGIRALSVGAVLRKVLLGSER